MSDEETEPTILDILEDQREALQTRLDDLIGRALDAASEGYHVSSAILDGIYKLECQLQALVTVRGHAATMVEGDDDGSD